MGASRYIGRIGGLAVVLGVGTAVFTGYGVAWAEPGSGSASSTGTQTSAGAGSTTTSTSDSPGAAVSKGRAKHSPWASGRAGTVHAYQSIPTANTSAPGASSDARAASSPSSSPIATTGKTTVADGTSHKPWGSGRSRSAAADVAANSPGSPPATNKVASSGTVVVTEVVAKTPPTRPPPSDLSAAMSPTTTTVSSPPVTANALVTMQPARPSAATPPPGFSTIVASVINEVLNPFAGNAPAAPGDPPTTWMLLAAVRRETVSPALVPANPITVNPTLTFSDGIIDGSANATDASGLSLAYTIVSVPSQGGKITYIPEEAAGNFTYLPDASVLTSGTEQFSELVNETTAFDTTLEGLPLIGLIAQPIVMQLYQVPGLSTALAPLIGAAVVVPFTADPSELNPTGAPAAFTTKVTSFDGTLISTNFFPASGLQSGQSAPTILEGPGLGGAGLTDPESQTGIASVPGLVPGIEPLRAAGYNVVTWDPRGEFASGGVLQLDSPAFEGKDVSAIITDVLSLPETADDQRIGMVGGSYGGGIQLVSAAIDPRIDAIVPGIAWNTLNSSLYANQAFKTSWAALLLLDLVQAGATINPQIYGGVLTGALLGILTPSQQALLTASGPGSLVSDITVPTLLIQGTVDGLFPLQQAVTNEQLLAANGVPVKMIWFCGGHGICLNPGDPTAQANLLTQDTLDWLDQYVKQDGTPADAIPNFQWVDQSGNFYSSNLFPTNPNFQGTPISASSTGGILPIVPIVGGSGPQTKVLQAPLSLVDAALLSLATAAPASNAINLTVPVPTGTQIVGAPQLSFTYSGVGTSRAVYAQIVDNQTGLVIGNIDTPIPVTLDGQTHTVSIALGTLQDIAYTAASPGSTLTLQLVGSATQFENVTAFGVINVSNMTLSLPTVGSGADATPEP
jgi:ABC-2 type transport system ATP-binding protein